MLTPRTEPRVFEALGHPTRLQLLERLRREGPLSTSALAEDATMTRQGVRKHLGVLSEVGLVRDQRQGRERLWTLDPRPLADAAGWLEGFRVLWEARLDRLDAHLQRIQQGEPT